MIAQAMSEVTGGLSLLMVGVLLALLVAAGVGLPLALRSSGGKRAGKITVVLALSAVTLAVLSLFLFRSSVPVGYSRTPAIPVPVPAADAVPVTRWESTADMGCASDAFPTMTSAAEGLTANLLRCLRAKGGVWANGNLVPSQQDLLVDTRRVRISCEAPESLRQELSSVITARVAHMLPQATISTDAPTSRPAEEVEPDELLITAMAAGSTVLNVCMRTPGLSVSELGRVPNVPWVEDPAAAPRAKGDAFAVYYSGLAHAHDDALRMALASASRELQPRLARRLGPSMPIDCTDVLMSDLHRKEIVKDSFVQPLRTSAGPTLYRAAVLVNISDFAEVRLARLASEYTAHRDSRAMALVGGGERAKWLGLVLLIVLIVLIYLVVNSMGRRYYVAVLLGAGAVIGVLLALA